MYITLIDHFGEEVLLQYHYEKLMESLVKKTVGVADVIGYLCKVCFLILCKGLHKPHTSAVEHKELHNLYIDTV